MSDTHNPDITHRKSRVFKSGFNVILGSLLFLVVLVGLYWLAGQSGQRIDLTRNQMYSLSDSTRNLLDKLEDRVTITVYSTEAGAPPEWTQAREELRELLTQYRNIADGNIQFSLHDVTPDSGTIERMRRARLAHLAQMPHLGRRWRQGRSTLKSQLN